MSGSNRLLAILLGVLAVLVLVVGGLSTVLLLSGRGGSDNKSSSSGGTSTGGTSGGSTAASAGTLRLPATDPVTLDPALAGDATSAEYIVEIFGGLVTINPKLEIVPDLAESFDVSQDGKQYTFHLRSDAVFHSGKTVTASDFKYSIERASSAQVASPLALSYLG